MYLLLGSYIIYLVFRFPRERCRTPTHRSCWSTGCLASPLQTATSTVPFFSWCSRRFRNATSRSPKSSVFSFHRLKCSQLLNPCNTRNKTITDYCSEKSVFCHLSISTFPVIISTDFSTDVSGCKCSLAQVFSSSYERQIRGITVVYV